MLRFTLALALLTSAFGCGRSRLVVPDPPMDGGPVDAGPVDAGPDAGPPPVVRDAGPLDAGPLMEDGGPDLPCAIEIAGPFGEPCACSGALTLDAERGLLFRQTDLGIEIADLTASGDPFVPVLLAETLDAFTGTQGDIDFAGGVLFVGGEAQLRAFDVTAFPPTERTPVDVAAPIEEVSAIDGFVAVIDERGALSVYDDNLVLQTSAMLPPGLEPLALDLRLLPALGAFQARVAAVDGGAIVRLDIDLPGGTATSAWTPMAFGLLHGSFASNGTDEVLAAGRTGTLGGTLVDDQLGVGASFGLGGLWSIGTERLRFFSEVDPPMLAAESDDVVIGNHIDAYRAGAVEYAYASTGGGFVVARLACPD